MNMSAQFTWKFQRLGGLDQVTLRTGEEIQHLAELDPKLWIALSCPASGLEFDARTLFLVDTDKDGRIRIPEVTEAVSWLCNILRDPAVIIEPQERMPLDFIKEATEEGGRIAASARAILSSLGKTGEQAIGYDDVTKALARAEQNVFNGDGILPPLADFDSDVRRYIEDALACIGGLTDAGGLPGIDLATSDAFVATLVAHSRWKKNILQDAAPLGEATAEAWALYQQLVDKVDDYFLRCDLASFIPLSSKCRDTATSAEDCLAAFVGHGILEKSDLAEWPLSRVEENRPLHLASGLNPAWRDILTRFFILAAPLLENAELLTHRNWQKIKESFASYQQALDKKPKPAAVQVTHPPTASPDTLDTAWIAQILTGNVADRFAALAAKDASAPTSLTDVAKVERLVLYYQHLHRLLMNFVSFYDFYSLKHGASFQYGTLYLDGRSCRLCLPVADPTRHSALASFSQLCLLYCECRRTTKNNEIKQMNIVAAMTAGDSSLLMEGRNGVFVDTKGDDWDATLVKLVSNPISLQQAIWEPYIRFGRAVGDQVRKYATADSTRKQIGAAITQTSATTATPAAGTSGSFDIGRSVGIFAAVGLALGALGTALAGIASALFALSWWQFPLVILGFFLLISGPSFCLAWLKLRRRTLAPLLEASGWAVNNNVPVNFTLGRALTATAVLPPNSSRSFKDPLRRSRRRLYAALALAVLTLAAWGWFSGVLERMLPRPSLQHNAQAYLWPGASDIRQHTQESAFGQKRHYPPVLTISPPAFKRIFCDCARPESPKAPVFL